MTAPYASAAPDYYARGWQGALPIPGKWPPPKGWTGTEGAWPSRADIAAWCEDSHTASLNIGLRLPAHVIGIDVDHYGGKPGRETLRAAEERWGRLPPTWISTSRDDGASGIRLFAIPEGLRWPSELPGGGVELIRLGHRYAMVWPSLHPEGRIYGWIAPSGDRVEALPGVDDLPNLPPAWIDGLTGGEAAEDLRRADLGNAETSLWMLEHGKGEPCPAMDAALKRAATELTAGGSRHDAATRATCRIAHLTQEGHPGGLAALTDLHRAFSKATRDPHRTSEFDRMIAGAVRLAAISPVLTADPCAGVGGPFGSPYAPSARLSAPASAQLVTVGTDTRTALVAVPSIEAGAPAEVDPAYSLAVRMEVAQQRARRDARKLLDDEEAEKKFRAPESTFTLTEELSLPDEPVAYRVASVLPTGGNVLLTAQFKAGKTTLVNNLARSLADGTPFLGALDVAPLGDGRVALWNYEVGRGQYRHWLREVGVQNTDAVTVLNLRGYRLPVSVPRVEDWIVGWLIERAVRVWIVDPFARAYGGTDENDNSEVSRFLDTLDVIKERAGVQELIIPTHTGRAEVEEGAERARGATRLDDWADVRWFLNKNEDRQRFFSAMGRDVEYPEVSLTFDESTRALLVSGGSRSAVRLGRVEQAVLNAVITEPGMTKNSLRVAVRAAINKVENSAVDAAIDSLEATDRIRVERGQKGYASHHFAVTQTPFGGLH